MFLELELELELKTRTNGNYFTLLEIRSVQNNAIISLIFRETE